MQTQEQISTSVLFHQYFTFLFSAFGIVRNEFFWEDL